MVTMGRWRASWRRLGAEVVPDPEPVLRLWDAPDRHHHGVGHLAHVLAVHDRHPGRDDVVELALWFHDAILDPRRSDNEIRSAALAIDMADRAGLAPHLGVAMASCIMATRHREPPDGRRERLMVDVDLAILGERRVVFDRYDAGIRAEYAHVPDGDYRRARAAILAGFLARPRIYRTPWCIRRFEGAARRNLRRAIGRLGPLP